MCGQAAQAKLAMSDHLTHPCGSRQLQASSQPWPAANLAPIGCQVRTDLCYHVGGGPKGKPFRGPAKGESKIFNVRRRSTCSRVGDPPPLYLASQTTGHAVGCWQGDSLPPFHLTFGFLQLPGGATFPFVQHLRWGNNQTSLSIANK